MSDPQSIRQHIGKKDSSLSPTPAQNPFQTRGFGKGIQARSAQLPTTNLLQTRGFGSPPQPSLQQQEPADIQTQRERAEQFGYNAADIPTFASGGTQLPPTNPALAVAEQIRNRYNAAQLAESGQNETVQRRKDGQQTKMSPDQIKHANRIRKARGLELLSIPQPANQNPPAVADQTASTVESQNAHNLKIPQILKELKSWNAVKECYLTTPDIMKKFAEYRKWYVDTKINELRKKYPTLIAKSVGSTDLSSDYDITVSTPETGEDVEAVNDFNNIVKSEFGVQPGTLFDTNLYAKDFLKVEGNIKADNQQQLAADKDLLQPENGLKEFSNLDQDVAALVKQRRFMNQTEWDKYTQTVVQNISDPEQAKAILKQYEEADGIYQIAAYELLSEVKQGLSSKRQSELKKQARKELGVEEQKVLKNIKDNNLRDEIEAQLLGEQELHLISHQQGDVVLEKSNQIYVQRMRQVRVLQTLINQPEDASDSEINSMKTEVKKLLGEACFFASEAYHSEGAVKHVVAGLQGPNSAQALAQLTPEHILQSYNEQLGDFLKDIVHYTPQEQKPNGSAGITFYRSSKYLYRLFDAVLEIKKRPQFQDLYLDIEAKSGQLSNLASAVKSELLAIRKGEKKFDSEEQRNQAAIEFVKSQFQVDSGENLKKTILKMSIDFNQKVRNKLSFTTDEETRKEYFKNVKITDSSRR
ncbi:MULTISPECIES: hypothetical protein [unclassified Coleofasciculus]|uniref:hypothetical protein n=1 Tax=unclassified Coleofasciculus TaxID=2692782 RepID=UPI0018824F48|nr:MULTISPECIES: hypothetical protein [unclassified Coleofasciculus]MBE9125559.1 hypothetical protein [Coleofasciculus sp. LEGE 07081]MBE9147806.1 hypothetical protein [Coleofasciculus sp. LEGE 07092]